MAEPDFELLYTEQKLIAKSNKVLFFIYFIAA